MAALDQAGTAVCEPMIRVSLEIPAETTGSVLAAVARLGGTAGTPVLRADLALLLRALLPAARAQDLQRQLPGLTSGEGVAETSFGGYRPVTGRRPPGGGPGRPAQPRGVHDAARGPGDGRLGAGRIEWWQMITRSALFRSWTWRPAPC